jgi:hypothetical protein
LWFYLKQKSKSVMRYEANDMIYFLDNKEMINWIYQTLDIIRYMKEYLCIDIWI